MITSNRPEPVYAPAAEDRGLGRKYGAALVLMACLITSISTAVMAQGAASKKRVVCWTEEDNRRACGDAVPPEYATSERKIIDQRGRVVKTIPGQMTPEEFAAHQDQLRQAEATKRNESQRAAYERALLQTYSRPEELAALRDDRLATIDSALLLTEAAAKRDQATLEQLRRRLPKPDSTRKAPAKVVKQIAEFEGVLKEHERNISDMRKQRKTLCATFDRDIRRFQELRSGTVSYESPCPETNSLAPQKTKLDLKSARAFFGRMVELERDHDPSRLDFYAPNALIYRKSAAAKGAPKQAEQTLKLDAYRKAVLKELPAAKSAAETITYDEVKVEDLSDGQARISGKRTSSRAPKDAHAFTLLIRPSGESWKIVEDRIAPSS